MEYVKILDVCAALKLALGIAGSGPFSSNENIVKDFDGHDFEVIVLSSVE